MIVQLCGGPQKTCVRVRKPTCGSVAEYCTGWKVHVSRVGCEQPAQPLNNWKPCWESPTEPDVPVASNCCSTPTPSTQVLEYPVFDTDESGRVCFYWDDKLLTSCPGRYNAQIIDSKGCNVAKFQIQLCDNQMIVDQISPVAAQPECKDCQ